MIDTGANFSAMNFEKAMQIQLPLIPYPGSAKLGNSSLIKFKGTSTITLATADGEFLSFQTKAIENLATDQIIGVDQLKPRGATIDMDRMKLFLDADSGKRIQLPLSTTHPFAGDKDIEFQVRCSEAVEIPANCRCIISVVLKMKEDKKYVNPSFKTKTPVLIEQDLKTKKKLPEGLWVSRCVVNAVNSDSVPLTIVNTSNAPISFNKNVVIAKSFLLAEKGLSLIELPELATEEYFNFMDANTKVEVDEDGNCFYDCYESMNDLESKNLCGNLSVDDDG